MREIQRLAVVGRGDPAMRALTAVAELNRDGDAPVITTVALHTDADAPAWYLREADEAMSLGSATYPDPGTGEPRPRYLDEPTILDALARVRADAVWLGHGPLAARASFAKRCEEAGILLVGPDSATLGLLADPAAPRRLAGRAGIAVAEPCDACSPWAGAPGGPDVAEHWRRVVVDLMADAYGTVWAAGLRDGSLRRAGRVVVDACANLDPVLDATIREAAVRLAALAGLRGAGTAEFLADPDAGRYRLIRLAPLPSAGHPVTEAVTGLDLAKLALRVARGERLGPQPPPARGHAVQARLRAEDPEASFAPAPGLLARLRLPAGTGIRVDAAVREGDRVPADDPLIAKVIAWGEDRSEALARLRRALHQSVAVVAGGTTDRAFLLSLVDNPEVRRQSAGEHWLDGLVAAGGHVPAADPLAVLVAAVESYEIDQEAARARFHAQAARGGPTAGGEVGHRCQLVYRGHRYDLCVYRTGARAYRVDSGAGLADVTVEHLGRYERRISVAGRAHRVVAVVDGTTLRVDVDGQAHTLVRDDGGVVRAQAPALVVSVRVAAGDVVAAGDPIAVVESMKMESTVVAPFAGTVASVETAENVQVDAGMPLVRIRTGTAAPDGGTPVSFAGLTPASAAGTAPCERVYEALRGYLLGYDLDRAGVSAMLTRQRRLAQTAPSTDPGLLACEDGLLDLFADVGALGRPRTPTGPGDAPVPGGTQEYLLAYLQWLDPERAGLPEAYRRRLERALLRYGVTGLDRRPELEDAVVWMYRSVRRVDEFVPVVAAILDRRLRCRAELAHLAGADLRPRLDRLVAAAQGRYPLVADLARDVRFRYLDEPLLSTIVAEEYERVERDLDALVADGSPEDRAARLDRLVACPQPLRAVLLRRWRGGDAPALRRVLLELHIRRYYRIRALHDLRVSDVDGLACADYEMDERRVHLVVAYAPVEALPALSHTVAAHLDGAPADRDVVVDLAMWRTGEPADAEATVAGLDKLLTEVDFGRPLHRLDITVTTVEGADPDRANTHHVTYRQCDGHFVEDTPYRDLHPMLAKRLELWRLGTFRLRRLRSVEDVYLFHGVARDNAADQRLFALAEVRDLTPAADGGDVPRYPRLELMALRALSAIREALATFPARERPAPNRAVLYVRPGWDVPQSAWPDLARSLAPLAAGAGLDKVVLRVRVGTTDRVLHVEDLGTGLTVREGPPGTEPMRPLTPYRQKVLRAQRFGAPYPFEIVRMLTPEPGTVSRFPVGRFVEHDLDDDGALVPVSRPAGLNTANIVAGVLTNDTAKVPGGMARVALFGDPTSGLGNLAWPECRRIMAALDLAERMRVPLEWYALSSGARIAMDSGTENMDAIAAVLRRLIEFTQAGHEVNIIVTGVNVGAQPYWNAEATMLMHTRGILVMTPASAMVLTGKQALDYSGGVSADDNFGIGGFDRVMGPNGQGQYWAATFEDACAILLRHYEHTYVVPGERYPRRARTTDPRDRDVRPSPHAALPGSDLRSVGDVFSAEHNADRKKPFDMRSVMRAVTDVDSEPLERWARWRGGETGIVWDAHIAGIPVCLLGIESYTITRHGFVPAGGPPLWTSGTLFPQSSRKLARAINAASGNRPLVVLANLSGFDGSPESMRRWQLEYGAEIGRAVTNFRGPIVFVVVSRYHGGAFVVFSKALNERMEIAAVEGSYASVIGGAPAAATVFAREVKARTDKDPRVREATERLREAGETNAGALRARLEQTVAAVRSEKLGEVADEFDAVHSIQRALAVGSVDRIITADRLRPYIVDALERGMARDG